MALQNAGSSLGVTVTAYFAMMNAEATAKAVTDLLTAAETTSMDQIAVSETHLDWDAMALGTQMIAQTPKTKESPATNTPVRQIAVRMTSMTDPMYHAGMKQDAFERVVKLYVARFSRVEGVQNIVVTYPVANLVQNFQVADGASSRCTA